MKPWNTYFLIWILFSPGIFGCVENGKAEQDSETVEDTGTLIDSATSEDTATSDDTGMKIRVVNRSPRAIRLHGDHPVTIAYRSDDKWEEDANLEAPGDNMACSEVDTGTIDCCVGFNLDLPLYEIPAGDTFTYRWDGVIFRTDAEACNCGCHHGDFPIAGEYRFTATVLPSSFCFEDPCDTAPSELNRFSATATFPFPEAGIEIVVLRDEHCDDGTEPLCDMVIPDCNPESEILAYQDNCYLCVDARTCSP